MWETAEKAGVITANLMWYVVRRLPMKTAQETFRPGPPKTTSGTSSTYFVPWEVLIQNTKKE
jgi:hypothetical protein